MVLNKARLSSSCSEESILIDINHQVQDEWDVPGQLRDVQVLMFNIAVLFSLVLTHPLQDKGSRKSRISCWWHRVESNVSEKLHIQYFNLSFASSLMEVVTPFMDDCRIRGSKECKTRRVTM